MKKTLLSLTLVLVLVFVFSAVPVSASTGQVPVGTCPPGCELGTEFMDHTDHEMHIGLTVDLNGNGFICVKHLNNGLHVHVDDVIRQSSIFDLLRMMFNLFF